MGGQHADEKGRDAHHHQRGDEHIFAAKFVAEMAEDESADRPRKEADRESAEGGDGAGERIELGKEKFIEHQRGGGAVDEIIVPLNRGANEAGEDDAADGSLGLGHDSSSGKSPGCRSAIPSLKCLRQTER